MAHFKPKIPPTALPVPLRHRQVHFPL